MSTTGLFSIEQIIAIVIVNVFGLASVCFLMYYFMREPSPDHKTKLGISLRVGLAMIGLIAIIAADSGIYFWIKSNDFRAMVMGLPLFICGVPLLFPVFVGGIYLQLIYREKIQDFTRSIVKDKTKIL
jgi:hypothetical protein